MLTSQHGFVAQAGVTIQFLPPLRLGLFWHISQNERDPVRDIDSRIRVIAFTRLPWHGQPISNKNDIPLDLLIGSERERPEILLNFEASRAVVTSSRGNQLVLIRQD